MGRKSELGQIASVSVTGPPPAKVLNAVYLTFRRAHCFL